MSKILDMIKTNPNWKEEIEKLNIKISYLDNFALFKYEMDADFFNPIVQEARGIIIDLAEERVVCYPFRKFGNYGEPYADEIEWSSAHIQEKVDGSIIKMWYDGVRWRVSTNGSIDAFTCANPQGRNFGSMFLEGVMKQNPYFFTHNCPLSRDCTYMFELVSPNNRIVVKYPETKVYHIGTRNNITEEELDIDIGIEKPKQYPFTSLDSCIMFLSDKDGLKYEGFVVVDKNWNRVKVKTPDYIRLHHMMGNTILTKERIVDLILGGEVDEYLTYFPEYADMIAAAEEIFRLDREQLESEIQDAIEQALPRKDYAIAHNKDKHFSFVVSKVYDNKDKEFDKRYYINLLKEAENE